MNASARRLVGWGLLLLLLVLASGCGRIKRVAQCRRLADHVNAALDEISQAQDAGAADPATYRALASRYEKLGREVDQFGNDDDAYGRSVKEYGSFLLETAAMLKLLSEATDKHDVVGIVKTRRDLGNLVRRDKASVAHIESACATP